VVVPSATSSTAVTPAHAAGEAAEGIIFPCGRN